MSSLAVGRGLEAMELWLGGLFTAAELAAADLLLQLSVAGAGGDDEAANSSSSTPYSSPRSRSPCLEDRTAAEARVVEETAVSRTTELDRRARKRYRLLSDLYAATSPVASASGANKKEKERKRHHHGDGSSSSSSSETRYGGDHYRKF